MVKPQKEQTLKKSSVIILGSILAFCASAEAASRLLVSEAIDRDEPRFMKRIRPLLRGSKYDAALTKKRDIAAERLKNTDTETVTVKAHDNVTLVGHLRRSPKEKRIILAAHGWRSSWTKDFGAISDFLYDEGCTVLYIEQRGQGESGGEYMTCGSLERLDLLTWLDWIVHSVSAENLPIYLYGISMGATSVLLASGLTLPDNVRGIIADCGFTSSEEIWRHVTEDNLHLSYPLIKRRVDSLYRRKTGVDPSSVSTVNAMKKNDLPVLFIHGIDDTFVPLKMTLKAFNACHAPKELLITENASHAMNYLAGPDKYKDALRDLWNPGK